MQKKKYVQENVPRWIFKEERTPARIREQDDKPPREADMRPCEWLSEEFMVKAGIKDEFDAYVRNADLEDFMQDKCPQYHYLTDSD